MHRLAGKAFGKHEDFTRFITSGKYIVTNIKKSVISGEALFTDLPGKPATAAEIIIHKGDKLTRETISVSSPISGTAAVLASESFSVCPAGRILFT